MANVTVPYMQGRRGAYYQRPPAMLWADNPGTISGGFHIPLGNEINSNADLSPDGEFIILSDDNRSTIDFGKIRIEKRERMINGRMRSYHIADKQKISVSWSMLPSRAANSNPAYETVDGGATPVGKSALSRAEQFTSDGGAGAVEMLDWYENHQGSFFVYLSYDKYSMFGKDDAAYQNVGKYNQVIEVFFSDFSYNVVKRGIHDFWDVSVTLEEV